MTTRTRTLARVLLPLLVVSGAFLLVPYLFAGQHFVNMPLMQFKAGLAIAEIHRTPSDAAAVKDLGQAQRMVLIAHEQVQQTSEKVQTNNTDPAAIKAAADAQKALEDAQKQAEQAAQKVAASPDQKTPAPDAQVKVLQDQLKVFRDHNEAQRSFNNKLALMFIVSGIVLAFVTSACSFLKFTKVAGILSILAGSLVSVPKVVPVNERAEYYRVLSVQSYNLLLESQLEINPTLDEYNDTVRRLKILLDYEADKYPSSANVAQTTQDLVQDLQAAKTTAMAKP